MNRDQWRITHALLHGWPLVRLIADFAWTKDHLVASQPGICGAGTRANVTRHGLEGSIDGAPLIKISWTELHRWVDAHPADVHTEAKACRTEWGAICHQRCAYDHGWQPLGPSWVEKYDTYGPLTQRAANAVDCDQREAALHERERQLVARLAPDDDPTDLLELLAQAGAA